MAMRKRNNYGATIDTGVGKALDLFETSPAKSAKPMAILTIGPYLPCMLTTVGAWLVYEADDVNMYGIGGMLVVVGIVLLWLDLKKAKLPGVSAQEAEEISIAHSSLDLIASDACATYVSGEVIQFQPGSIDAGTVARFGPTAMIHDGTVSEDNRIQLRLRDGTYVWVELRCIRKHSDQSDSSSLIIDTPAPAINKRTKTSTAVFSSGEAIDFKPGAVDAKYGPTATIHDGTVSEGKQIQVCLRDGTYTWVDLGSIRKRCGQSDNSSFANKPALTPGKKSGKRVGKKKGKNGGKKGRNQQDSAVVPAMRASAGVSSAGAGVVPGNAIAMFSSGEDVDFKPGAVDAKYGPTATIHDGTVSEGNQIQVCLRDGTYMWVDLGSIRKTATADPALLEATSEAEEAADASDSTTSSVD
jgi:hypothetical protein